VSGKMVKIWPKIRALIDTDIYPPDTTEMGWYSDRMSKSSFYGITKHIL
jgi:hypothetical protein